MKKLIKATTLTVCLLILYNISIFIISVIYNINIIEKLDWEYIVLYLWPFCSIILLVFWLIYDPIDKNERWVLDLMQGSFDCLFWLRDYDK